MFHFGSRKFGYRLGMMIGCEIASSMILVNHDCVVQNGTITIAFLHSSSIFCSILQMMLKGGKT